MFCKAFSDTWFAIHKPASRPFLTLMLLYCWFLLQEASLRIWVSFFLCNFFHFSSLRRCSKMELTRTRKDSNKTMVTHMLIMGYKSVRTAFCGVTAQILITTSSSMYTNIDVDSRGICTISLVALVPHVNHCHKSTGNSQDFVVYTNTGSSPTLLRLSVMDFEFCPLS